MYILQDPRILVFCLGLKKGHDECWMGHSLNKCSSVWEVYPVIGWDSGEVCILSFDKITNNFGRLLVPLVSPHTRHLNNMKEIGPPLNIGSEY
jgi:hypothetical protein